MKRQFVCVLILCGIYGSAAAVPTNLIMNGDFSQGLSSWQRFRSDTGWAIHWYNSVQIGAGNETNGYVWQSFQTTPGQNYTVSFDGTAFGSSFLACLTGASILDGQGIAGSTITSYIYTNEQPQLVFKAFSFDFTASSNLSTLKIFDAGDSLSYDNVIDNVSVTPTPEPCTIVLLCLGGMMLRKKAKAIS